MRQYAPLDRNHLANNTKRPIKGGPKRLMAICAFPSAGRGAFWYIHPMIKQDVSVEWLRRFVSETSSATWVVDADGYVMDVPEWVALTGQKPTEVAGDGWMAALHPDDIDRVRAAWETAVTHQSHYNTDYRLRCADGIYRWFNARGVPMLDGEGGVLKWFGVVLPIAGSARLSRNDQAMRPLRADQFADITPGALRAARALLNWPAEKLADEAGVSRSTIRRLESGEATTTPRRGSVEKILSVLARQTIRCLGQNGVIEGVVCQERPDLPVPLVRPANHSTH